MGLKFKKINQHFSFSLFTLSLILFLIFFVRFLTVRFSRSAWRFRWRVRRMTRRRLFGLDLDLEAMMDFDGWFGRGEERWMTRQGRQVPG